ncbi:MAG: hypothetical protein LBR73_03220 [Oscillospiraceae bacterium]|jgi:ethanolamine utilization cobalamin adenosyltransferase|nr:hypothetical protein [Oscillospiraceae bacterium]
MNLIDEAKLRSMCLPEGFVLELPAGTLVTPLAREYSAARHIVLRFQPSTGKQSPPQRPAGMPQTKPEHMTHLNAHTLVAKTHPQIAFRGKLDTLRALLLQTELSAPERARHRLEECHTLIGEILTAEVTGTPLPPPTLFGLDDAQLRETTHHVEEAFGISHPLPSAEMGAFPVALNYLRTQVREAELSAMHAFTDKDGELTRADILRSMNRLSSAVYILFLEAVTGREV